MTRRVAAITMGSMADMERSISTLPRRGGGRVKRPLRRSVGVRRRRGVRAAAATVVVALVAAVAGPVAPAHAAGGFLGNLVTLTGPGITSPFGVAASPDGTYIWYTNFAENSVGRIALAAPGVGGTFTDASISEPTAIAARGDGFAVFVNRGDSSIGVVSPSGAVSRLSYSGLVNPTALAINSFGAAWIADRGVPTQGGSGGLYFISAGPGTPGVIVEALASRVGGRFYGIALAPNGDMWATDADGGFADGAIWVLRPNGDIRNWLFDDGIRNPRGISAGPDGNMWFLNDFGQSVGRISPDGQGGYNFDYFTDADLGADIGFYLPIVAGPDGNLWFINNNAFVRVTMAGEIDLFHHADLGYPTGLTVGPDGNIWFADFKKLGFFDPTSATIDVTVPTASPTVAPLANAAGWHNSAVTVSWNWADEPGGSGIDDDNCTTSTTTSFEGSGRTLTATCRDVAGNVGTATETVNIDTTAPTLAPVFTPDPVLVGGAASASAGATDALSGVASQSCDALDTTSVGVKSVTCTATDYAGNTTSMAVSYEVVYDFGGFGAPIDDGAEFTEIKAGQVVPISFRITDANGDPVTDLDDAELTVTVTTVACDLGSAVDDTIETAAGGSGLLNLGDGNYRWNWKTSKDYAGSCKRMHLSLGDGIAHDADFHFIR
jgi:streptogramin lyase